MVFNLTTSLLDLIHEINDSDMKLIVGGGFGIYLKSEYVRKNNLKTLFEALPDCSATNDSDLFLHSDLQLYSNKQKPLSSAIQNLGYDVIIGTQKNQYTNQRKTGENVSINIITNHDHIVQEKKLQKASRRVHTNTSVNLNSHEVNDAVSIEDNLLPISLSGNLSTGEHFYADVYLPHAYTLLLTKIFAFIEHLNDINKELGRCHALDIYTVVATILEKEWVEIRYLYSRYKRNLHVIDASHYVHQLFTEKSHLGILRLKECKYFLPNLMIDDFISAMKEIFTV